MRIKTKEELKQLLLNNGWYQKPLHSNDWLTAPYNENYLCITYLKQFVHTNDLSMIYGQINNMRSVTWLYNENTGILDNGICAFRIK